MNTYQSEPAAITMLWGSHVINAAISSGATCVEIPRFLCVAAEGNSYLPGLVPGAVTRNIPSLEECRRTNISPHTNLRLGQMRNKAANGCTHASGREELISHRKESVIAGFVLCPLFASIMFFAASKLKPQPSASSHAESALHG